MLRRSTIREIRGSLGRYLAIIAIIALGVGFFAGLRGTKPAMLETATEFLSESGFFDYHIVSTLGYDKNSADELKAVDGVRDAVGSVSVDVLCAFSNGDRVINAMYLTEDVNEVRLMSGRLPTSPNECVADASTFLKSDIGTQLELSSANDEDTMDSFAYDSYTIVGLAASPMYLNYERGSSSLGNGKVEGFVCILPEGFDTDYYTELYLTLEKTGPLYSDEYTENVSAMEGAVTSVSERSATNRYERILSEAETELADAHTELDDAKIEFEDKKLEVAQELADARQELYDARIELDDGWIEYYDGIETFNTEIADAEIEIADAEIELADGYIELLDGEAEYASGVLALESGIMKYEDGLKQYSDGLASYEEGLADYNEGAQELEDARRELQIAKGSLERGEREYQAGKAQFDMLVGGIVQQLNALGVPVDSDSLLAALSAGDPDLTAATDGILAGMASMGIEGVPENSAALLSVQSQLSSASSKLSSGWSSYRAGMREYEKGKASMKDAEDGLKLAKTRLDSAKVELDDALIEIEDGKTELRDAKVELADGWTEYNDGVQELADAKVTLEEERLKGEQELADAYIELTDGEVKYADGIIEYNDGKEEADREFADAEVEIADAEVKLADAEEELRDLKKPTVYVLGRETNIGYACFDSDSSIVQGVSRVFPIFFFLVAALVCMTTMARMVEEQRTQIGVLKALGYSSGKIMSKYLFYSGSAALIGSVLGFTVGSYFIPKILWMAYSIMYDFGAISTAFDPVMAVGAVAVCLSLALGVTYLSCRSELSDVPAELIRPKSPQTGKRVFLEYIPPIWNRLKFLQKVSVRNLMRYKKRFFMMVLGISGCTALLLTGYGVDDSISNLTNYQFSEVTLYDCAVTFTDVLTDETKAEFLADSAGAVHSAVFVHESSADIRSDSGVKSVSLIVSPQSLDGYVNMVSEDDESISLPGKGEAVINNGLAKALGLKKGDVITVSDADMNAAQVVVSGVFRNFVLNYAYISPETYEDAFGECEYKSAYVLMPEGVEYHTAAAQILDHESVAAVSINEDIRSRVDAMMGSMNYIVALIVACAGALAFIVLYNLTNINITERIREIATLKVLGFYPNETASYVFRENMMLTAIGALCGLLLGIWLHAFVMSQIVVDMVCFDLRIAPMSFLYAVLWTFGFSIFVSLIMRVKLDKINMAESLKSIE